MKVSLDGERLMLKEMEFVGLALVSTIKSTIKITWITTGEKLEEITSKLTIGIINFFWK